MRAGKRKSRKVVPLLCFPAFLLSCSIALLLSRILSTPNPDTENTATHADCFPVVGENMRVQLRPDTLAT